MGICDKWMQDNQAKCIYFAVLIVLIFLAVFYLKKVAGPERFEQPGYGNTTEWAASISGSGLGDPQGVARSQGAGRRQAFAGQFSQPNQGLRNTKYNADVVAIGQVLGTPAATTIASGQGDDRAIAAAASETLPGSMERLVNYRYAPQFDETWSEELQRYQAMTPPVEYKVLDDATRGFVSGERFAAQSLFEIANAGGVGQPN